MSMTNYIHMCIKYPKYVAGFMSECNLVNCLKNGVIFLHI